MLSGKRRGVLSIAVLLIFLIASEFGGSAGDFEVWLVDQSNSFGKTYGGTIHIYEGEHLNGAAANFAQPISVIDLGAGTAGLARRRLALTRSDRTCSSSIRRAATPSCHSW